MSIYGGVSKKIEKRKVADDSEAGKGGGKRGEDEILAIIFYLIDKRKFLFVIM